MQQESATPTTTRRSSRAKLRAKPLPRRMPVKVVAFSAADTEDEICECAAAGIAGYVARNGSNEDLIAAVENAIRGEVLCSPRAAASLFRRLAAHVQTTKQQPPEAALTRREQDIIALIDRGL
jgi:two-component system, NarL family, nitrate/nitrite response regulator NarL